MADFSDNREILEVLEDFMSRETPLATCLPKGNGRREDRYSHLLCGDVSEEIIEASKPTGKASFDETTDIEIKDDLLQRIAELEKRLDTLEKELSLA